MKITYWEKLKTIALFFLFSFVMLVKLIVAKFIYPISYLLKDWIYADDYIQRWDKPSGVKTNYIKWFFWLFLDDAQPEGYTEKYAKRILGHEEPQTKWEHFKVCYAWSALRNPAYNINRFYLSTWSDLIYCKKTFGKYACDKKLRSKNNDKGVQLAWFRTADNHVRFIFSLANYELPITFFIGWNPQFNGRMTIALRFSGN